MSEPDPSAPETAALIPCPTCGSAGRLCADVFIKNHHFVGCSNELDCPVWPVTAAFPTPAEAIAAWNKGNTH